MIPTISGLHHVTAITADAQKNLDFYRGVLGLRLVKLTVNFDDPGSYHLYYGDELGRPGTILTFFAWPGAAPGRLGPPQVTTTSFAVPPEAMIYWSDRLARYGASPHSLADRFGQPVLQFQDPDAMSLEIIAQPQPLGEPWPAGPTPPQYAIRAFHGITISQEGYERTAKLLTDTMGFQAVAHDSNRFRYRAAGGQDLAAYVDLLCVPDSPHGELGAGIVHHVAFRTETDAQQEAWRNQLVSLGYNVSPVMDRNYFHSIYYREPGGVLFEIATDTPGFTIDQSASELGAKLMLPSQFERHRVAIEQSLPPLRLTPAA